MRLGALFIAALCLVGVTAAQAARAPNFKPVIGAPRAVPAVPRAGERFIVSFRVMRSDSGAPLTRAAMVCDPSVDGVVLNHIESFRQGLARMSLLVPETADGRALIVRLTIRANGRSAHRVATFRIPAAPLPALAVQDVSAEEGNAGATTFSFPVTLSSSSKKVVSVDYATADGTALAGSDYAAASGTISFQPGEVAKTIPVLVTGDLTQEPDETFTLHLSRPVNATPGRESATATIIGDELVLISPSPAVPVPQNLPGTGCGTSTRGNVFITFTWRVSAPADIAAYRLLVQHRGSTIPLVNAGLGGDSTTVTYRSCDAYVADANLDGWEWSVTAVNRNGVDIAYAHGTFSFAPCRLADGTACHP